jgi:mono/diheme cytochrome c family protein
MTKRLRGLWAVAGTAAIIGLLAGEPGLRAQTASTPGVEAPDGAELFRDHCASCHGPTGVGNGPIASVLRQRPANLTQYAIQNGGVFPDMKLRRVIDGRDVAAHGTRDMPVWGSVFRTSREGLSEEAVKSWIDAIVRYIESIQMMRSH